jgi:dihydrofolate synthase/folylpolyglutamate synthase
MARTLDKTETILERLKRLHPRLIDLSLVRIERLLAQLGHPERRLPPAIHIAGTNGKGSLLAYLRAILEAAGYRVHAFSSPHLVRFNERIYLAGRDIDDALLHDVLEDCERVNGAEPITLFEISTAAAFLAFLRVPADVLILETGLGGRLDSTNVLDKPALTALTPISFDHMQHLGGTLAAIAEEKAGIMKRGVAAVVGPQPDEAAAVFVRRAAELDATLHRWGREWTITPSDRGMLYRGAGIALDLPRPNLAGAHQLDNAGTAVACIEKLQGFTVTDRAVREGLTHAHWPARMQRLVRGPLVEALPGPWELWLDGGHNAAAGEVIAEMARVWAKRDGRPLHVVFGMINTKEPAAFLRALAPVASALHAVTVPDEANAIPAADLAAAARATNLRAAAADSVAAALKAILAEEKGPARVLICGSLYLAGHVLGANG